MTGCAGWAQQHCVLHVVWVLLPEQDAVVACCCLHTPATILLRSQAADRVDPLLLAAPPHQRHRQGMAALQRHAAGRDISSAGTIRAAAAAARSRQHRPPARQASQANGGWQHRGHSHSACWRGRCHPSCCSRAGAAPAWLRSPAAEPTAGGGGHSGLHLCGCLGEVPASLWAAVRC